MFSVLFFFSLLYFRGISTSGLPRCPYPLAEDVEPCICTVDEQYRMVLTCKFNTDFTEESFQKITDAFDCNREIYAFEIDLDSFYDHSFYPQLNKENLGKLNITNFSLKNAVLKQQLFGEGAFEGSVGSISNITVEGMKSANVNTSIDLGTHVLHSACPTLQSLKLESVSQLSSTTLTWSPRLVEVSLKQATFPILPSSMFSTENVPNIKSIEIGVLDTLNLQTDAFRDLESLTNLEISATKIDIIQSYAFNNLPNLKSLEMKGINIVRIEEDAFKNLTSLESFEISNSEIKELPRIFSNSQELRTFSLTNSQIEILDANAFDGILSVEELNLNDNHELLEFHLANMKNLTKINLSGGYKLATVDISGMPRLNSLSLESSFVLSLVRLDHLPALTTLAISKNREEISLSIDISNCENLETVASRSNNLVSLSLHNVNVLANLNLQGNNHLNHTGLGTSLHSIINPDTKISLRYTNVRNLDESVFRPLLETFTSAEDSSGYVDMYYVSLDCGCDVKWIIEDFHFQTKYFVNAVCVDGQFLANVS